MSHQDNEKNKRLRETIESLPAMTRDTAERARGPLVTVGPEKHCACQEDGADGTANHGEPEWEARVRVSPELLVIAHVCANHKQNYSHWDSIAALAQALQPEEKEEDRGQD